MLQTTYFCAGNLDTAKILVISHDRRLQISDTLADNPFFGDYYFKPTPTQRSELQEYKLAEAVFDYVGCLTKGK